MAKIIHGNKSFGYAPIVTSSSGTSFGTPVMIPGLVGATIEVSQNDTNIYADDKVFCSIKGAKVRSASVRLRFIPAAYAAFLGYSSNTNGMLTDTGSFANHCIFFETEEEDCETGESTRTLHYLYNVKASTPTIESATDEEEVEAREIEVAYTCTDSSFVVDDNGDYVQYGYVTRTAQNAAKYDLFTSGVILPTTVLS